MTATKGADPVVTALQAEGLSKGATPFNAGTAMSSGQIKTRE